MREFLKDWAVGVECKLFVTYLNTPDTTFGH